MKVKFSRCQSSSLANVPLTDGQFIFVKDTGDCYLDVATERIKLENKELLETVKLLQTELEELVERTEAELVRIDTKVNDETARLDYRIDNIEAMHGFEEYEGLVTNGTTKQFFQSVQALDLNPGTMLLGATKLTDIEDVAPGMKNEEMKVEIYPNNVIHATMTSTDVAPYEWTIQFWHGDEKWKSFGTVTAETTTFDPSETELEATTTQEAIVELDTKVGDISKLLDKINGAEVNN